MHRTVIHRTLTLCTVLLMGGAAQAGLVAYFPINASTDTGKFLDDVIDDPAHPITDATTANNGGSIIFDATRGGDVLSTIQGHRLVGGDQGSDLSVGFTWSLWVKVSATAPGNSDSGSDVIIGSRSGIWNKVQTTGTARWFDLGNYNLLDNTWHHIAYTGSAALGASFWVDGVKKSTDLTPLSAIQVTGVNDNFEIGGTAQFSEDMEGLIDDIAVWNEVLSDQRIIALANGEAVLPEPGTIALLAIGGLLAGARRRKI